MIQDTYAIIQLMFVEVLNFSAVLHYKKKKQTILRYLKPSLFTKHTVKMSVEKHTLQKLRF